MLEVVTALGPDDPDDGDTGRQSRGLAIAAIAQISKNKLGYKVPSQSRQRHLRRKCLATKTRIAVVQISRSD